MHIAAAEGLTCQPAYQTLCPHAWVCTLNCCLLQRQGTALNPAHLNKLKIIKLLVIFDHFLPLIYPIRFRFRHQALARSCKPATGPQGTYRPTQMHLLRLLVPRLSGLALTLFACLAAHSQASPPWSTFASLDDRPRTSVAQDQTRLMFLRPLSAQDSGAPVDIWIDGRFHTTVLPGAFSEALVCSGRRSIELARQTGYGPGARTASAWPTQSRQTSYLLIQTQGERNVQTALSAEQAQSMLPLLRRQTHTVSRLAGAQDCAPPPAVATAALPPAAPAPVAPVALPAPMPSLAVAPPAAVPTPMAAPASPTRYTLAAEMLFNFAGYKPQHLSEQGQTQIVRLGKRIKEQLKPGQVVVVQGHTDPMGSASLNQRLSLERAQTVSRILINSGLPARQVRSEGLGSSQLLVKDCQWEAKTRTDRLNCNRPNRRVEITVLPAKN